MGDLTREWTIVLRMNIKDDCKPAAVAAEEEDDLDVEIEGKFLIYDYIKMLSFMLRILIPLIPR